MSAVPADVAGVGREVSQLPQPAHVVADVAVWPATADDVKARDAAIKAKLKSGPTRFERLRDAMPHVPGMTDAQIDKACRDALTRMRLKKEVRSETSGDWEMWELT